MIHTTHIYVITNIDNNPNKVYIGKSNNPKVRKHKHNSRFGDNIDIQIIDTIEYKDKIEWIYWESYWIEQFKQWGFTLINKNSGGGGPQFHTEETKLKMKRTLSLSTKQKMSKPRINKDGFSKPKIHLRIPINQLGENNEVINTFSSTIEAADKLKLNNNAINNVLRGKAKTSGGFGWEYKNNLDS